MATVAGFRQAIGGLLRNPEVRESKKDKLITMLGWSDAVVRRVIQDSEMQSVIVVPYFRYGYVQRRTLTWTAPRTRWRSVALPCMCIATSCARETLQPEG